MPRTKAVPVRRTPFTRNNLARPARGGLDVDYTRPAGERIPPRPTDTHDFRWAQATQPAHLASAVRGWLHDNFWGVHALRGDGAPTTPRGVDGRYNSRQAGSLDAAMAQYFRDVAPRGRVNGVGPNAYIYRGMLKPRTKRWRVGTYTSFSKSKAVAMHFARIAEGDARSARDKGVVLRLRASDVPRSISFGTAKIPNIRALVSSGHEVTRAEQEILLPPGVFVLKGSAVRIPGTKMYMYDTAFVTSRSAASANGSIKLHGASRRLHLAMFSR